MNIRECAVVVAKIQAGDNRRADEIVVREWFDSIGDLDFDEAVAAVTEHRKTSSAYLMPHHLFDIAKRHREAAAEARHHQAVASGPKTGHPMPENDAAMSRAYRRHDLAYDAYIEDPANPERSAALDAALVDVEHEEAAYNRQLVAAGIPPISNPIPLRGMTTRGVLV